MTRAQKKCLIFSASLHVLLFVVLLVGPAWLAVHEPRPVTTLELIPLNFKVTDGETTGGQPAPQPEPQPQPQPRPEPPPPQPQPQPQVKPVEPPKPRPEPVKQPQPVVQAKAPEPKPERRRPDVKVNLNRVVTRNASDEKPAPQPSAPRPNPTSVVRDLRQNLSSSMDIPTPTGSGGEAYINYAMLVKAEYDRAWDRPAQISDDSASVKVSVTIARDGRVIDAKIVRRSGIPAMDNSIEQALKLRKLPPFPPESKDSRRTFDIVFKLSAN